MRHSCCFIVHFQHFETGKKKEMVNGSFYQVFDMSRTLAVLTELFHFFLSPSGKLCTALPFCGIQSAY
jgi:hypothetical protein